MFATPVRVGERPGDAGLRGNRPGSSRCVVEQNPLGSLAATGPSQAHTPVPAPALMATAFGGGDPPDMHHGRIRKT